MQLHKPFKWHLFLLCPTGQLTRSSGSEKPGLQSEAASQYGSLGGVELVAASPDPLEWENHSSEVNTNSDSVRCLPLQMGSSVRRGEHRRLMDPTRTAYAHKLPRIVGSRFGLEIIPERPVRSHSPAAAGQLHSCGIYQQLGGDNLTSPHSSSKNTVALGTGEGHLNHSPTHPRSVQYCGRLRIQDGEGQVGPDAAPSSIPEDQRYSGAPRDRSVCLTTDFPATMVFQLEARPPSSSSGCLSTGLESVERVCQPPMVFGGTGTEQGGI